MYLPVLISHSHNSHRLSKGMIQITKTFECFARIMIQEGNLRVHFNIIHKYTLRNCHIMFTHTHTHTKKSNSNSSKLFENKFLSRACILAKNAFLYYLSIYAAIGLLNKPVSLQLNNSHWSASRLPKYAFDNIYNSTAIFSLQLSQADIPNNLSIVGEQMFCLLCCKQTIYK